MNQDTPTRSDAYTLLTAYNQSEHLIRHALTVEAVMRHFAKLFEEDEEKWGIIGLVHDLDYEQFPDQHCHKVAEILQEQQWPQEYLRAIVSHGWKICSDTEPLSKLEQVLYTIDELTGLIAAAVLVRPDKNIFNLEVKSVKKKWKDKSFAAGVNREVIAEGAERLGMEVEAVIRETILGMRPVAEAIGLQGRLDN